MADRLFEGRAGTEPPSFGVVQKEKRKETKGRAVARTNLQACTLSISRRWPGRCGKGYRCKESVFSAPRRVAEECLSLMDGWM